MLDCGIISSLVCDLHMFPLWVRCAGRCPIHALSPTDYIYIYISLYIYIWSAAGPYADAYSRCAAFLLIFLVWSVRALIYSFWYFVRQYELTIAAVVIVIRPMHSALPGSVTGQCAAAPWELFINAFWQY